LLVHDTGTVVDNLHGVGRLADGTRTFGRLGNLAAVNVDLNCMIADLTSEEGVLHVRNDRGGADNKTLDRNNLVDI
jgi:hypothetical protein